MVEQLTAFEHFRFFNCSTVRLLKYADGDGVRKENQKLKSKNQKCNKDEEISNS